VHDFQAFGEALTDKLINEIAEKSTSRRNG